MNKEVNYQGLTTVPSDYECADGALALSLNLINEDGAIHPIPQPKPVLQLQDGERVLLIHNAPAGQKNYILARENADGTQSVYWLPKESNPSELPDTSGATLIATVLTILDASAVGNILILASEGSLSYILWKDGAYLPLGTRPPFISIDFGLICMGTLNESEQFSIPARCAPGWNDERGTAEKEELASFTQMVYSVLNPAVADKVTSKGYFYQPFFVRYAYRLYDGTHAWHSAPILMLPIVTPPYIGYTDDGSHPGAEGKLKATLSLNVDYFSLMYRILADGVERLKDWADIIVGIDIFVSAPIYTYDQSKDLEWRPVTTYGNMLLSTYGTRSYGRPGFVGTTGPVPTSVFTGHYAKNILTKYIDHYADVDQSQNVIDIKLHERFHSNIRSAHEFYKFAEIDIKDIKASASMAWLKPIEIDLSSLVARERLSDDYQSHFGIGASCLYSFNSRLNLAGVKLTPPEPFPIRSCMQFGNPDGMTETSVQIKVWSRINGVRCLALHNGLTSIDADTLHNPAVNLPKYLYYPDASAYKMELFISAAQKYTLNLTPHDFLNGAYWYSGDLSSVAPSDDAEPETAQCASSVDVASKVYTSEVNNPFFFPVTGINTVGSGRVLALSSAARALSQGQFGQFPLYAFTSEGVWALETNSTGSYSARQPITRDVCINPRGITQIDTAVLFPTDRGIMLISGSQTRCISDPIGSEHPFDPHKLPAFSSVLGILSPGQMPTPISLLPFSDFLRDCGMVYDYAHQRIILFNPASSYAYVYSLKSTLWGMAKVSLKSRLNSYPEALATDGEGRLVDFSLPGDNIDAGLLITRPLKLDYPDVLKTIDCVIQRGDFTPGQLNTILYGSRDLHNWYVVWSSKDNTLRGLHGTPYKYFRLLTICRLGSSDSLYRATFSFAPRLTNHLR